ncbi:MAG: PAS domain S-box protein [Proteobacteria bacterium]|nr:PAS domain S-box protein [Pseudomonadota bacterium]MBU2630879.1 PAS domain S-box protein [Pseudomonadota bacterium]
MNMAKNPIYMKTKKEARASDKFDCFGKQSLGLGRGKKRFRGILENMDHWIWEVDSKGRYTDCSKSVEKILGYFPKDLIGKTPFDLMEPQEAERVAAVFNKIISGKTPIKDLENWNLHKNGMRVCLLTNGVPVMDAKGELYGYRGVDRDITECKLAEEALRESERRYKNIFNNAYVGLFHSRLSDGKIVTANKRMSEIFGYQTIEDCINNYVAIEHYVYPEMRDELITTLKKCGRIDRFETAIRKDDGSIVWIQFSGSLSSENGFFEGVVIDITERKKAENALRKSEERFKTMFEQAPLGIALINSKTGHINEVNSRFAEIAGRSREEMTSIDWMSITHPDDVQGDLDTMVLLNAGKITGFNMEKRYLRPDGSYVWINMTIAPIKVADKTHPLHLCMIEDITEIKSKEKEKEKLQAQLLQAQKMEAVGRLAGGVAHDFNNMLTVIKGYAELLLTEAGKDTPLNNDLTEILTAANRSMDITRQLLAFARKQTIAPMVVKLNVVVKSMLKLLKRLLGENIEIVWHPGEKLWPVKIDPSQVDQVLANLCVNSRDAIPDVGNVTIETKNMVFDDAYCADHRGFIPGEYVQLAVSDNGSGMDKQTVDQIFEPFFTTKKTGQGTGLGLATVYGIMKQNNGFINVYSEPGHGTTFHLYFPRHAGNIDVIRKKKTTKALQGQGETILVVEDEISILNLTQKILEGLGYIVLTAGTPGEAIRIAKEKTNEIHMLITDVVMPEMNGRDLAERLQFLCTNLKCLFMSGYTANVIAHHGILDEGVHFIQKPVSRDELAAKVRELLEISPE